MGRSARVPAGRVAFEGLSALGIIHPHLYGIRDLAVFGEAVTLHATTSPVVHDFLVRLLLVDSNYDPPSLSIIALRAAAFDLFLEGAHLPRIPALPPAEKDKLKAALTA